MGWVRLFMRYFVLNGAVSLACAVSIICLSEVAVIAEQSVSMPLAAQTFDKIAKPTELARMMTNNPGGRFRVIIQYDNSSIGAPAGAGSPEDDRQYIARNHALQDLVLLETFGSSQAVVSGPLSIAYGVRRMDFSQLFVINLTADEIDRVAANVRVTRIYPDITFQPTLDESTTQINMPTVWIAGGTGAGRAVAIIDTGVKKSHEFITPSRVVSEACYNSNVAESNATSRCPGGVEISTATDSGSDCSESFASGCGHGTHVAGIAAGNNTNRQTGEPLHGVAYEANIVAINVFSKFDNTGATSPACDPAANPCVLAFWSDIVRGIDHIFSIRSTYNIDAITLNLGSGAYSAPCDQTDLLEPIITTLASEGTAVVVAAGNEGLDNAVNSPACISTAVSVASSLDTANTRSSFSNWGDLIDVVAPGSNIRSSAYGSSETDTSRYLEYNGTSMAAPHVAGAFAALRSIFPSKAIWEIEDAIKSTGVPITSAGTTKPRIDVLAACNALGGGNCIPAPSNDNFFSAMPIVDFPFSVTGQTNVAATSETNEPRLSAPNNTVWYSFTLQETSIVHIDTNGSSLDTYIGLFSGPSVGFLAALGINDDGGTDFASLIERPLTAGTYYIAVDGYGSTTGTFNLNVTWYSGALRSASILAAVLPTARATQSGTPVTAFATIVNSSENAASSCSIGLPTPISGTSFFYQTTDSANAPIGKANTPVGIAAGGSQGFYFALSPTAAASSNIPLVFDCANALPASTIYGVNTFQYTASSTPIADMVAIAATVGNTGYISIPGASGQAAASVAAVNIGATQTITASVTGQAIGGTDPGMPATLSICRANSSGVCQTAFEASTSFTAIAGETYYFVVLAQGNGSVYDNPASNRAHIYFRNTSSQVVGATSVAIRTQ
ncbi:S8 family serine peptidase [Zhengella mangrovi]|nr:S8 family serine peptidase [Zhengella mangrovi]